MALLFSKRCKQALNDKKIKVSIPVSTRVRIWKAFQEFGESWWETDDEGWNHETHSLSELPEKIKAELGIPELIAFPVGSSEPKSSNLEGFVLRGNYPPYLLDAIELYYGLLPEKKYQFQVRINEIMEESDLPWRLAGNKIFPIDSIYIDEQITRKATDLLAEVQFNGALEEFERARVDLTNGYSEGAIQNANLAVESTIKEILGIERAKPGELFNKLIETGIVPEYFNGFLKDFEASILRSVAIIRNEELGVGHGKGPSRKVVPIELAEFAVHMSGVLMLFLIKGHLKKASEIPIS